MIVLIIHISSKDHLVRNVNDALYSILPSRDLGNQKFKHTVQVQINVKTALGVRHFDTRQWDKDWSCQDPSEAIVSFLPLHIWEFFIHKIL